LGEREKIPDDKLPSFVGHGSFKAPNILLGNLTPGDSDHGLVPILKVGYNGYGVMIQALQ
jgi:hypothetical protein